MSDTFEAILVNKPSEHSYSVELTRLSEEDLMEGDVLVRVEYSTLNYKDGLALTGKGPIIRKFPLVPGIDLSGTVEQSTHADYKPGDKVVLNGWGVGETHFGGYAGKARVNGDWLVPLPAGFTTAQAMAIGTAGYTAMLSVLALEHENITPDRGDVLVTGASGGVGSVAVAVLAKLGFRVVAATGRTDEADYLKQIGAADVVDRNQFSGKPKPLARERWAAAVDVAGGETLANVLSAIQADGAVAASGLADSMDLPTSVAPFILRGVTLCGINSVYVTKEKRIQCWQRLERDLDVALLDSMTTTVALKDLPPLGEQIVEGKVRGRTVVEVP